MTHPLQTKLNALISVDHRPVVERNRISEHMGRKRTTIRRAAVGAAAVKDLVIQTLANAGITHAQALKAGPLLPSAIEQIAGAGAGQGATCWIEAVMLYLAYFAPTYLDNLIIPLDTSNVIVLLQWSGEVVAIHMTLEVSTSYNNPNDDDVRPELMLKAFALILSANWQTTTIADMAKDDYGDPGTAAYAMGLTHIGTPVNVTSLTAALAVKGQGVLLLTPANPPGGYIGSHCYLFRATASGGFTAQQPWYGGVDLLVPSAAVVLQNFQSAIAVSVPAVLPLTRALVAGEIPAKPEPTVITGPVVPVGSPITYLRPALQSMFISNTQGYLPTLGVWGDSKLPLPDVGTFDVLITAEPGAKSFAVNGVDCAVGTAIKATSPIVITAGHGGGNVLGVTLTPANVTTTPTTPVVYTVIVGGQTYSNVLSGSLLLSDASTVKIGA